jgi:hypothetical protein
MLAHARIFVPGDLALDTEWRSKTHSAVEAAASEGGLTAEVRDLLKEVLTDVEIVEDLGFKRRADRALAEYDGVVEPGEDIVYEYCWQAADGTWSSWRRTPDTGELDYPDEAREIQHRTAAAPPVRLPTRCRNGPCTASGEGGCPPIDDETGSRR